MQIEFVVADLLTVAGVGAVTLIVLQIALKPLLNAVGTSEEFDRWRPLVINLSALGVSILLAFLAQAVLGISYESGLQAFLTGLGGALVAIGGYEGIKNTTAAFRG